MRALMGILFALLAFTAQPAAAQQDVTNPPDPWIHAATGAAFPAVVGEFERGRVVVYSADGRDASVGYNLRKDDGVLVVTLYVYPTRADFDCPETFKDAQLAIQNYKGAQVLSETLVASPSGTHGKVARFASYRIPKGAMRADIPETRSDLYLFCPKSGEWLVKYRATWLSDINFEGSADALLHALRWPSKLDQ